MKRRYGEVSLALVLGLIVVVMAAVVVVQVSEAVTFETSLTASVADPAAGGTSDVTTEFAIAVGSAQYGATATFTPPEFTQTAGADIPIGALVGELNANATLGLINGPCNSALPVTFDMMNATTDTSATLTFDEQFQDADANTLPDGVDKFPDFITRMLPGVTPVFRQFGQASVAGSAVSLNFVVAAPGSTIPGLGAIDPSWGYISVSVLNNNGDPGATAAPGPITEFCTPLSTEVTTFGTSQDNPATSADESGTTILTNPANGGPYTFRARSISLYDTDDDNIDNSIDTCPYVANTGDPTVAGDGDQDNDGIDDACDPTPTETKVDEDDDAYTNRGDNCPLVANGADPDNQKDGDTDGIGDACDQNPTTADGGSASPVDVTDEATVEITGGAPPAATETVVASPTAATPGASPTAATATATKTATVAPPTATPVPTPTTVVVGGGGLLGGDEGFPTWAFVLIGMAAVLLLGGLGTAVTVNRRNK